MRQLDNRNLDEFTNYQQDRIDALKRRVAELESALRFVLDSPGATFEDLTGVIQTRRHGVRKDKSA
jgi:hypothetical protein